MRRYLLYCSQISEWVLVLAAFLFSISTAYAVTPTLTLTNNSGTISIDVVGDSNAPATLYYNGTSCPIGMQQFSQLGNTNVSGSLTSALSSTASPINPGTSVCVYVNGQYSAMKIWPATTTASTSGSLSFSPSNPTVAIGQTVNVNIAAGSGFYLSANSNSGVASAVLGGSAVAVTGIATGSTLITVCSASNGCGTFTATVGSGGTSSGGISFDKPNPAVAIGQTVNVNITGGSGYYILTNSNTGVVAVTLSGATVSILGGSNGSATVTICSVSNGCSSINATVGSSNTSSGGVTFGQTNPTIPSGQSLSVSLSGGSGSYFISNATGAAATPSVIGSSLSLVGQNPGSASITVCASSGGCGTISVTVTSASTTTIATVAPTPASAPTPTPVPTPTPTSQITSNIALIAQVAALQKQLAQILAEIQEMQTKLAQLAAQIGSASLSPSPSPGASAASAPASGSGYQFVNSISLGSNGPDVMALQTLLTAKGFYSGAITGYYGALTMSAVMAYQTAHGIAPLGNVGPSTRASLNAQ